MPAETYVRFLHWRLQSQVTLNRCTPLCCMLRPQLYVPVLHCGLMLHTCLVVCAQTA